MTWPLPPLDAPSLAALLDRGGPASIDIPTLAAMGALLGSQVATAEDDRLPARRLDAASIRDLVEMVTPHCAPDLQDTFPRVVRAAFERVEPWLDIRRRQGLHRGILGSIGELHLQGRGSALELSREPGRVRADPLEELSELLLALELAGHWSGAEALLGGWLAQELDPRAVMLMPLLRVIAILRRFRPDGDGGADPGLTSPGRRSVLLRHAWAHLSAPARRPRLLLITGASAGLRSAVGHALMSRLRGALLLELEHDAPTGEWLGPLASALADMQVVLMTAPQRPGALHGALRELVCRCDQTWLVEGATPFPAPVEEGVRRIEAQLPEEVLATAILASIR